MQRRSVQAIREIAEAVARDEREPVEVTGVMPGEARGRYAEVLVVRRSPGAEAKQMLIGVARDLPEADLRDAIATKLRQGTRTAPRSDTHPN